MKPHSTGLLLDPVYRDHDTGGGHPECPDRYRAIMSALEKADLVMISAGFDSRVGDPLGRFQLTDADFASLTKHLMQFADSECEGRIVSVLEGGYNLGGLASAVKSHVETLMDHAGA